MFVCFLQENGKQLHIINATHFSSCRSTKIQWGKWGIKCHWEYRRVYVSPTSKTQDDWRHDGREQNRMSYFPTAFLHTHIFHCDSVHPTKKTEGAERNKFLVSSCSPQFCLCCRFFRACRERRKATRKNSDQAGLVSQLHAGWKVTNKMVLHICQRWSGPDEKKKMQFYLNCSVNHIN